MKILCTLLIGASLLAAELSTPQIGHIRDGAGRWRPVFGVAGAFRIGAPLEEAVEPANATAVTIDGDEVVIGRSAVRVRLPRAVTVVRPMGPEWYALDTADGLLALRTTEGKEALFELPGVEE